MPRDGSNIYSQPFPDAVEDTTIESTVYNGFTNDVAADLNAARPIVAGGTGATNADQALFNLAAEKAAQVVTNYDSHLWVPGSFRSATTATGSPVTDHAFAGVCYIGEALANPPTNQNVIVEAIDTTDPTNIVKYIRVKTAGVWGSWTGVSSGSAAASIGEYTFDTGITFPPAAGQIRLNNATQNSATEIFISHTTTLGGDVTNLVPFSLKAGSDIAIQDKDEIAKYKIFTATANPVLSGGDYRVTATFKSGGTDIATTQRVLVGATDGGVVRYDAVQSLTATQQAQARSNTGTPAANVVINGDFRINQGGYVSAAVLAAAAYGHDQWKAGASGGDYSFTQLPSSTQITIASGKSLVQPIEDVRVVGGSYVLSWTGTAQARAGVNTLTPAGAYAASPLSIVGQNAGSVMSVEFNTGTLGTVKLESGTIATPFVMPDYASELAACMRYYEPLEGWLSAFCATTNIVRAGFSYKFTKRATPTVFTKNITLTNVNNQNGNNIPASVTLNAGTLTNGCGLDFNMSATMTANSTAVVQVNANSLFFNARL